MSIIAAIIQALGTIAAASIAVLLWRLQMRRDREKATAEQLDRDERERRARQEKIGDMLAALHADILVELPYLRLQFEDSKLESVRAKFMARLLDSRRPHDRKDMPQAPVVENFVFETLKKEFAMLPRGVIEEIVSYYRNDQRLSRLAQAFADGMYEGLSDERQGEAISFYLDLGQKTLEAAVAAERAIVAFEASHAHGRTRHTIASDGSPPALPSSDRRDDGSNHRVSPENADR